MVNKNKYVVQTLIFDRDIFPTKSSVKNWIAKKNKYIIMTSKGANAVAKYKGAYRARQKNPNKFKRKTFRTVNVRKGVKAVEGILK